jgi:hypothetical protein
MRHQDSSVSWVGVKASTFVQGLPDLVDEVQAFTFVVYSPRPSLAERLKPVSSELTEEVFRNADSLRDLTNQALPYWESIIAAAWTSERFEAFVNEATKHDASERGERLIHVPAGEVRAGRLDDEIAALDTTEVIGLDSRCALADGSAAHLPLMDFRIVPRDGDTEKLWYALEAIGERRGAILKSGRSYHYYGFRVLPHDKWEAFCAKCLLLSPLTDSRYVAHRLLAGAAALRLSNTAIKPEIPYVVSIKSR